MKENGYKFYNTENIMKIFEIVYLEKYTNTNKPNI